MQRLFEPYLHSPCTPSILSTLSFTTQISKRRAKKIYTCCVPVARAGPSYQIKKVGTSRTLMLPLHWSHFARIPFLFLFLSSLQFSHSGTGNYQLNWSTVCYFPPLQNQAKDILKGAFLETLIYRITEQLRLKGTFRGQLVQSLCSRATLELIAQDHVQSVLNMSKKEDSAISLGNLCLVTSTVKKKKKKFQWFLISFRTSYVSLSIHCLWSSH